MSTSLETRFRSRPAYRTLSPVEAAGHLLIAEGEGALALLDLIKRAPQGFLDNASIVYAQGTGGSENLDALQTLSCRRLHISPTAHAALARIQAILSEMHMGTQIYLSGNEVALSLFMKACTDAHIDHQALQAEHRGSLARRVQCVHCKGITEGVTTQPAQCSHCSLLLLIRDHYSRRIGAYQGVNINAEDPTEVPSVEELFP